VLANGHASDDVRKLQEKLKAHGFDPGEVDGIFGPKTEAAVRAFQQARGIEVDGIVGPITWGKLNEAPPAAPAPAPGPAPGTDGSGPLLKKGLRGGPVRELQDRLRALGFDPGATDGDFGPNTEGAVKAFQAAKGLEVDGVVGPQTWKALGIHVKGDVEGAPSGPGPTGEAVLDGKPMVYRNGKPIHAHLSADWDRMVAAAAADGVRLSVTSGYRTIAEQQALWNDALKKYGSADAARKWVAPPGKSNHQSGKAIDVGASDGHAWLRRNGAKFGFSQPMSWEPWHWEHAV
jgi:peptidoglycan hydrolase-like protein with peptidoglycan-binding domain